MEKYLTRKNTDKFGNIF